MKNLKEYRAVYAPFTNAPVAVIKDSAGNEQYAVTNDELCVNEFANIFKYYLNYVGNTVAGIDPSNVETFATEVGESLARNVVGRYRNHYVPILPKFGETYKGNYPTSISLKPTGVQVTASGNNINVSITLRGLTDYADGDVINYGTSVSTFGSVYSSSELPAEVKTFSDGVPQVVQKVCDRFDAFAHYAIKLTDDILHNKMPFETEDYNDETTNTGASTSDYAETYNALNGMAQNLRQRTNTQGTQSNTFKSTRSNGQSKWDNVLKAKQFQTAYEEFIDSLADFFIDPRSIQDMLDWNLCRCDECIIQVGEDINE